MAPDVRHTVAKDAAQLATMLVRAFLEDPVAKWVFPRPDERARLLRRFFYLQLRWNYLRRGEAYTVEDCAAISLWLAPLARASTLPERVGQLSLALASPSRYLAMRRLGQFLSYRHPSVPHYYLGTIGTDPSRQGRGLGSALLDPVLTRCDELRIPVYLECSRAETVPFYVRHGFSVIEEVDLPDAGPRLWLMWRLPSS